MKSIVFIICYLVIFIQESLLPQVFSSEPIIKVRIVYSLDSLNIIFNNNWSLIDNTNNKLLSVSKNDSLLFTIKGNQISAKSVSTNTESLFSDIQLISDIPEGTLMIRDVPYGIGWWWEGFEDRTYEGEILISINKNNKFDVIVVLNLEKYLCGVVPYEIGNDAPLEALKAQVIAARSETISALVSGKYRGDNYDLCADVECQVFAGNKKRTDLTDRAVDETKGLCIFYDQKVMGAYYASNCGGISESVENVWPERSDAVPYWSTNFDSDSKLNYDPINNPEEWIDSNPEVFCNPNIHSELPEWSKKNFRWKVEMTNDELTDNLNQIKNIGTLIDIKIIERGNSGRIIKALFIGDKDSLELNSELDIRKIKNPPFRSSCFVVKQSSDDESNKKYLFKGAGWGHGVGMCQSGAVARAYSGQNYNQILSHYFPKTYIKSIYNY